MEFYSEVQQPELETDHEILPSAEKRMSGATG